MEIWKDIKGYEGLYQVSDLGRIKSLCRYIEHARHGRYLRKEVMLKPKKEKNGYTRVELHKNKSRKMFGIHQLVVYAFTGELSNHNTVVDHINNIKTDNRLVNLQLISAKQNVQKYHNTQNQSSSFTGVSFCKTHKKWSSRITVNKQRKLLGWFDTEQEAININLEYQNNPSTR